jgi:hypothetical protein
MMTGEGPMGAIGMGGMFSTVKVRRDQKAGDYKDPGWFKHPQGTVAYEFTGAPPEPARAAAPKAAAKPTADVEVTVRKPNHHRH